MLERRLLCQSGGVADQFRFLTLRAFARQPRLLVVVPSAEVQWAAAGLGALSRYCQARTHGLRTAGKYAPDV